MNTIFLHQLHAVENPPRQLLAYLFYGQIHWLSLCQGDGLSEGLLPEQIKASFKVPKNKQNILESKRLYQVRRPKRYLSTNSIFSQNFSCLRRKNCKIVNVTYKKWIKFLFKDVKESTTRGNILWQTYLQSIAHHLRESSDSDILSW